MIEFLIVLTYLGVYVSLATIVGALIMGIAEGQGLHSGMICRWGSLWVGAHYSEYNRRWCINLFPCVTVWVVLKGGNTPGEHK